MSGFRVERSNLDYDYKDYVTLMTNALAIIWTRVTSSIT